MKQLDQSTEAMTGRPALIATRDSNPGPVFSIPVFGIGEFLIPPGSWDPGGIMESRLYHTKNRYY